MLFTVGLAAGLQTAQAVVVAFILSLCSTASALQLLGERKELAARQGRAACAVLLFQDMAVIPTLALIPLAGAGDIDSHEFSLRAVGEVVLIVTAMALGGGFVLAVDDVEASVRTARLVRDNFPHLNAVARAG